MLKNVKYVKIYKISLHICKLNFMNRIDIILKYNSGRTKKYAIINIRVLIMSVPI